MSSEELPMSQPTEPVDDSPEAGSEPRAVLGGTAPDTQEMEAFTDNTPTTQESPLHPEPKTGAVAQEVSQPISADLSQQIAELQAQKQALLADIEHLQSRQTQLLSEQVAEVQETLSRLVKEGTRELEQRKQALEVAVEQLERRRDRIREEMRTTFAGVSQDLAIRVQGFKDYLVGSLQDLAAAAEQLELPSLEQWEKPKAEKPAPARTEETSQVPFAQQRFQEQARQIRQLLEQYRTRPDYYGPPWQLRRTFEPIHAERVQNWFFSQGGRGAIRSMGSRLQNILIASAAISILHKIYGDRCRPLILANTPERLGEWRRGLQDCLGISRSDFSPERGIGLFEAPEALVQKADRLVEQKQVPVIIVDEAEDQVNLSLLQFSLWLAFAPDPQQMSSYMY
jgi:ElaB/YqjD/DUF883 family membrane-anchored ribosome-binding protein